MTTLGLLTTPPGDPARVELTMAGAAQFHNLRQSIDSVTERLYGDLPVDESSTTRRVLGVVRERANGELEGRSRIATK